MLRYASILALQAAVIAGLHLFEASASEADPCTISSAQSLVDPEAQASVVFRFPGGDALTQAEVNLLDEVGRSGVIFRNRKFWDFFFERRKDPWFVPNRLRRWYPFDGPYPGLVEKYRAKLTHYYQMLLLDPVILQRSEEFFQFAARYTREHLGAHPFELRQAFADHLKRQYFELNQREFEVWRGIYLTDEEVRAIGDKSNPGIGITGNLFRQAPEVVRARLGLYLLGKGPANLSDVVSTPLSDMGRRLGGAVPYSAYTSYSQWIEPTYAAFPQIARGTHVPKAKFRLFRVRVSPLEVVRPEGVLSHLKQTGRTYHTQAVGGGHFEKPFDDPGFENFIQWVAPEEIVEVITYDNPPPGWSASGS